MIREHRDKWYKTVTGEAPGTVVRASPYTPFGNCRYSFVRDEFIHPLILRELLGWLSDADETVAAVNLTAANRSNRFFGEFCPCRHDDGTLFVRWRHGRESFTYTHIATSPSGIEMAAARTGAVEVVCSAALGCSTSNKTERWSTSTTARLSPSAS